MTFPRLKMQWNGDVLIPATGVWSNVCNKNLVVGETYWIKEDLERSSRSHNHYFACISEGHAQLPERIAEGFPGKEGPELLRKYCLIKAGYHHMSKHIFSSPRDAMKAAVLAEDRLNPDRFTITKADGCVVTKWVAETQSMKAMGAKRFQESKSAVLEIIAGMIGVPVQQLTQNAEKAA